MLVRDQLVERAKDFFIILDDVSIVSVCQSVVEFLYTVQLLCRLISVLDGSTLLL